MPCSWICMNHLPVFTSFAFHQLQHTVFQTRVVVVVVGGVSLNENDPKVSDCRGEEQRGETSMLGKNPNASRSQETHYTHLQCLWTPATVSMMEHSPSFRQKARSLSSTHGLNISERRLGSVGATAIDRRQRHRFNYYWRESLKTRHSSMYSVIFALKQALILEEYTLLFETGDSC